MPMPKSHRAKILPAIGVLSDRKEYKLSCGSLFLTELVDKFSMMG